MSSTKPRQRLYYGWWVVIACAVIQFYLGGTFFQGFSALFNPIADEFNWSYAAISLAFTFRGFESGIMAPVVGILVDRFGPRRLMVTGVVISGLGFWFFSRIDALWNFYGAFLFLALGLSLGTGVVTMTAVARWFRTRTGLAMGILTSGFGASGILMPLVVQFVDDLGWRESSLIFAVGTAVLCLPLAFLIKDPPDLKTPAPQEKSSQIAKSVSAGTRPVDVLKSREFWLLSLAVLFGGVAGQAIIVHQIPYLVSVGISRQTASVLVIVLSLSNVAGRLFFGYVGDKVEKRRAFAVSAAINAVGVLGFSLAVTAGQFIPALIAFGVGFGGLIPLRPALQLEFFGIKSFATIQGFLMISVTVASLISPIFAGWMFDAMGTYRWAFIVLAAATLLTIPAVLWAKKKRAGINKTG
jgi:MFS family permease